MPTDDATSAMHIVEVEQGNGDPAYFAHGHVDKAAFIQEANKQFDEEFDAEDAEHLYLTDRRLRPGQEPDSEGEGDNCWWLCKPDDEGAFPATFVRP